MDKVFSFKYIALAIIVAIIIRTVLTFFKAMGINNGEIDDPAKTVKDEKKWKGEGIIKAFKCSFWSNSGDLRIDDYWLPYIIGLSELLAYPVLMDKGYWMGIVTWLALKTASTWGAWQKTRTAYNRFLVGNILSLGCSFLLKLMWF